MSGNLPDFNELSAIFGDEKSFMLRVVQPRLAGLMDGSVSTLAPVFAAGVVIGHPSGRRRLYGAKRVT